MKPLALLTLIAGTTLANDWVHNDRFSNHEDIARAAAPYVILSFTLSFHAILFS